MRSLPKRGLQPERPPLHPKCTALLAPGRSEDVQRFVTPLSYRLGGPERGWAWGPGELKESGGGLLMVR